MVARSPRIGGMSRMKSFIASLVAIVIISVGAAVALGSLDWSSQRVYSSAFVR